MISVPDGRCSHTVSLAKGMPPKSMCSSSGCHGPGKVLESSCKPPTSGRFARKPGAPYNRACGKAAAQCAKKRWWFLLGATMNSTAPNASSSACSPSVMGIGECSQSLRPGSRTTVIRVVIGSPFTLNAWGTCQRFSVSGMSMTGILPCFAKCVLMDCDIMEFC